MLDSIINSLKSEVGGEILEKANLSSDKLDGIFSVIGESATKEVSSNMLGGDFSTVMNLFSKNKNNSSANTLQSNITSSVISGLISKLGLSESISKIIADIAVPSLIGLITKKNDETPEDDSSPLTNIFGGKEAGKGGVFGKVLGKFFKS
jgi:hypothetical protein